MENQESSSLLIFDQGLLDERDYWVKHLSRELGVSNLPLDFQRPKTFSGNREAVELEITGPVYKKLSDLTGGGDFLLYTSLVAALKICLYKYTGNTTVAVGSPVRKRPAATSEPGNALAMVSEVRGELSFRQLLVEVRKTLVDAYARSKFPFDRLVKALNLANDDSKCMLFDVALLLKNIHADLPEVKNDITISLGKEPEGVYGFIHFNTDLFRRETIARFAKHYVNVLSQALNDTTMPVSGIELLTREERDRLIVEWNDTGEPFPDDACLHWLFEAQAERTPGATAIAFESECISYSELNSRANQLAHYLIKNGVGPEVRAGIYMERSVEAVVALLAVLKAGGAYIPLDPAYPIDRLTFMLEDAQVAVLLTLDHLIMALPPVAAASEVITLDSDWNIIASEKDSNPVTEVSARNLAYVIYTSGATGNPKGVLIEHRGVCNLAQAQVKAFGLDQYSRVLQYASLSFDASVSEIFTTLLTGGELHLAKQDSLLPGPSLASLLRDCSITAVTLPPSVLAVQNEGGLDDLETVVSAGESCSTDIVARWGKGRRFINAYGPTETSVCATMADCSGDESLTIGRPIPNTKVYLLGADQNPVPVGVAGEVHVGGVGLARGYLNRPDLTAEKLVPNPFSREPGARLYKTGDLARYLADGRLEFLGRVDHQVKIRGYRIELGEIESLLTNNPGIEDAVVMAREDSPGDKRLVAYVVAGEPASVHASELKNLLKQKLPDFMVPTNFVIMDRFPITANGKVDRRALPPPETGRPDVKSEYVAPNSDGEKIIAAIWQEVLNIEEVGIYDHFFDLGGNSLLLVQVHAGLLEHFDTDVTIVDLMIYPTIHSLASYIIQEGAELLPSEEREVTADRLSAGQDRQRERLNQMRQLDA
jgi:surfactin family lipopeptide synthetase A